jgi:hypothetical protein
MLWRYGPSILAHRHELVEGSEEAIEQRKAFATDALRDGFDKWARLNRELSILADKLISAYFLIVWDFVNWARDSAASRAGPWLGRGHDGRLCAGPVQRLPGALRPAVRAIHRPRPCEYPDIDIDLCQDGRARSSTTCARSTATSRRSSPSARSRPGRRSAMSAACSSVPLSEVDKLAKLDPRELGITLDRPSPGARSQEGVRHDKPGARGDRQRARARRPGPARFGPRRGRDRGHPAAGQHRPAVQAVGT